MNNYITFIQRCASAVSSWFLLLNPDKTEAVIFRNRQRLAGFDSSPGIDIASSIVSFNNLLKLLDATLSFDKHVSNVVHGYTFHTRALRYIRPLLTVEAAKTAAAAVVGTKLDYCNSLLYGLTDRTSTVYSESKTLPCVVLQAP